MNRLESFTENTADLEMYVAEAYRELNIPLSIQSEISLLLRPLKEKSEIHRQHLNHSLRVGLLNLNIAKFLHLPVNPLLYDGLLHDVGKKDLSEGLLDKHAWTDEDNQAKKIHVMSGYLSISDKFPFTADTIVCHHKFQQDPYPDDLPAPLRNWSNRSKKLLAMNRLILPLADQYDALHRQKFDGSGNPYFLSDQEIENILLAQFSYKRELIGGLYDAGIFINSDKIKVTNVDTG
jgi:response regulator RpfG family c-di-GMP phosphodiesterase